MDIKEYAQVVADCRKAQKEYFRTRSTAALEQSKALEKALDAATAEVVNGGRQERLF